MCHVSTIIKTRRSELNLTLEDIGKAVGVSKATVQRWESGNIKTVRSDKLAALADVLEISPAQLIAAYQADGNATMSPEHRELIDLFDGADPIYRQVAIDLLRAHQKKDTGKSAM